MELIYSKQNPKMILHIVYRANEFYNIKEGHRKDIVDAEEFIQLSALKMKKGKTFEPHQHIWKNGEELWFQVLVSFLVLVIQSLKY